RSPTGFCDALARSDSCCALHTSLRVAVRQAAIAATVSRRIPRILELRAFRWMRRNLSHDSHERYWTKGVGRGAWSVERGAWRSALHAQRPTSRPRASDRHTAGGAHNREGDAFHHARRRHDLVRAFAERLLERGLRVLDVNERHAAPRLR